MIKSYAHVVLVCMFVSSLAICCQDGNAQNDSTISIDHMENLRWGIYNDSEENCSIELSMAEGELPNSAGVNISYDFKEKNTWVGIYKRIDFGEFPPLEGLRFHYNGNGTPNSIELKLVDKRGRTFGYICSCATVTDGWRTIEADERDIEYWWGGPTSLSPIKHVDLGEVEEIHFAISNKLGDALGKGYIIIDEVEGIKKQGWIEKHWDKIRDLISIIAIILSGIFGYIKGGKKKIK